MQKGKGKERKMGKKKKKNKGKKGGERNKGKRGGKRGGKERKKKSKPKSQAEAGLTFWSWINKWKMPGDIPGCHQWASTTCLMELGICSHSDTARAVAPSLPQKEPAAAQERTGCGSTSEGLCASSCPCPSSSAWGLAPRALHDYLKSRLTRSLSRTKNIFTRVNWKVKS